jgi:hypothetical protein
VKSADIKNGTIKSVDVKACDGRSGRFKGFAQINASPSFSSTFTTEAIVKPYNCSGGTVEALRSSTGDYAVRFNGAPLGIALVSPTLVSSNSTGFTVTTQPYGSPTRQFQVIVQQSINGAKVDQDFVIALL